MTQSPLLTVENLSIDLRTHQGTNRVVNGLSFDIPSGRTLALVGESGSGKTMTAMSLIGLTPIGAALEVTGRAVYRRQNLFALDDAAMRAFRGAEIAAIFQDPSAALNPLMSIGAQITEAVAHHVHKAGNASRRVKELLNEVGLGKVPSATQRYPHELSGGQQQRAAIAIALAGDPSLLIADEPTTALDMTVQAQILDLLKHLQQQRGMALLLITHDLGVVANYADKVLVMRAGETIEYGDTETILNAPVSDYTKNLIESRPRVHDYIDRERSAVKSDSSSLALSVSDLVVTYPGHTPFDAPIRAVDGVSFDVPQGTSLGIVGESGSGKSTIAKTVIGLTRMATGRVALTGRNIADPRAMSATDRRAVQYIFQDSYGALNPRLTVENAIAEPLVISGVPRKLRKARVIALLEEVGLSEIHLNRLPRELSGGQRQRVNIARALALEPQILICDEIVSALDVSVQAQVLDLLKSLQKRRELTLIFISHDLAVIAEICDRVAIMLNGRIVEIGPVDRVFASPAQAYTRQLLVAAEALEGQPRQSLFNEISSDYHAAE